MAVCLYCLVGWIVLYPVASTPQVVVRWSDPRLGSPRVELRIYPVIIALCLALGLANVVCGVATTAQLPSKGVMRRDVLGSAVLTLASLVIAVGLVLRAVVAFTAYGDSKATGVFPPESFFYGVNHLAAEALIGGGMLFIALFSLYALRRRRIAAASALPADSYVPLQDSVPPAYSHY